MTKKNVPLFGEDKATEMLAKALALHAFRNPLEQFHGGEPVRSKTGDYSDVKVVTPDGEFPWTEVSRISDEEMKILMMDVVSKLYTLLVGLDDKSVQAMICAHAPVAVERWATPSIEEELRRYILHPYDRPARIIVAAVTDIIEKCEADRRSKAQAK